MTDLRPFRAGDIDSLYAISLATGDRGGDASALHRDGRLIGHIYSAPYALLHPELAFVAEDSEGIGGFILGVIDTRAFEARLESDWWPALRRRYPDPGPRPDPDWSADQRRAFMIHRPTPAPEHVVAGYPAHLHMNLLPRLQGRGFGARALQHWLDAAVRMGAGGAHVTPNAQNLRAIRFWRAQGFDPIPDPAPRGEVRLGRRLEPGRDPSA